MLLLGFIPKANARRILQKLAGFFGRDFVFELDRKRLRVRTDDRHAHAGAGDEQIVVMEHLAAFILHLHFFARIALIVKAANLRNEVVSDGIREDLAGSGRAGRRFHLSLKLINAALAGTGNGLIGRSDEALHFSLAVQRRDGRKTDDRGAVRIGNEPLAPLDVFGVDFRDNERDFRIQPEGARIVDHRNAELGGVGQELLGHIVVSRA